MALTFYWRAENSTSLDATHDYTVNDSTATASSATFNASAAYKGSYGVLLPASTASYYSFTATDLINSAASPATSVGCAGFMVKFAGAIQTTTGIYYGFRTLNISGTNDTIQTITGADDGAGHMKMALSIGSVSAGALTLTTPNYCVVADEWYFVVARWDIANDKRALEVYDTAGSLVDSVEDTTTNLGANAPAVLNQVRWGRTAGHANDVYLDNLFIADTYDEPLQNNLNIVSYTQYGASAGVLTLKLLADASAASASSVQGVVLNATRDTVIGEFSGQAFEAALESGEAVLLIPLTDIIPDGTTLTTSDTALVSAYNASDGTVGLGAATVVEI